MTLLLKEVYSEFLSESRKKFNLRRWFEESKKIESEESNGDLNHILTMKKFALRKMAGDSLLGEGTSRVVAAIDSSKVLKQAINRKGIAQNEQEVDAYTNPSIKPLLAKIFNADDNYEWVISELVRPLTREEFMKLFKVRTPGAVSYILEYIEMRFVKKNAIDPEWINKAFRMYGQNMTAESLMHDFKTNPFYKNLIGAIVHGKLAIGDLGVSEHWGKTHDGRVVLLDYGLTKEIYKKYYRV